MTDFNESPWATVFISQDKMADQQNRDSSSNPNRPTTQENSNNSVPLSSYPAYLSWSQYWQYYYMYNYYYYNSLYYSALSRQRPTAGVDQNNTTFPVLQQNVGVNTMWTPQAQQRMVNGGATGPITIGRTGEGNASAIRYEFVIAPLRKRAFAEFIDFVFLYFLKFLLYSLYFKNSDQLTQMQYSHFIMIVDEATSLKEIEEALVQALIYRLIVFLYEAFFIAVPLLSNFGGATPGKYMMGITVISYQGLTPIPGQNLYHLSGSVPRRLSPWHACIRAVLKNFMITFFFPIMLTAMFVRDFRTPYDFMACSIVVDNNPKRLRHN